MKKKNIRLMYLLALLQGMVFYAPIATLYRQAQGVSIAQITQIESLSLALSILLELPWGILADRIHGLLQLALFRFKTGVLAGLRLRRISGRTGDAQRGFCRTFRGGHHHSLSVL